MAVVSHRFDGTVSAGEMAHMLAVRSDWLIEHTPGLGIPHESLGSELRYRPHAVRLWLERLPSIREVHRG